MDLPVYRLTITEKEDSKEIFTALVDRPAIESNFVAFNSEHPIQFSANDERRIITGPVLIPDFKIYRKDEKHGEHYVYFTKEDIELFRKKWAEGNRYNAINEMHNRAKQPQGMFLLDSFITDNQIGISAPMSLKEQFPEGTWFHSYYVPDDELWGKVKSGQYKGFSMEMMANYIFSEQDRPDTAESQIEELISILNKF